MGIGEKPLKNVKNTKEKEATEPVNGYSESSWGIFFAVAAVSTGAVSILACIDLIWSVTSLRLWFVLPVGQILVGCGIGFLFGTLYRLAHAMPSIREIVVSTFVAAAIFLFGEWFNYKILTFVRDGQTIKVSDIVTFEEFHELQFQGKRKLRMGRAGQVDAGTYDANPGYEKFMHFLGFVLLGLGAAGTFAGMTRGEHFCNKCKRYFDTTNSTTLNFTSVDELGSRLEKAESAQFGSKESLKILLQAPNNDGGNTAANLRLTVTQLKCACGIQIIKWTVSKLVDKEWKEISSLKATIQLAAGETDMSELFSRKSA